MTGVKGGSEFAQGYKWLLLTSSLTTVVYHLEDGAAEVTSYLALESKGFIACWLT